MSFISFTWTTPPLLAGAKTFTWREWTDSYARQFHRGDTVDIYDKSPRNGGRRVATISLRYAPVQCTTGTLADSDYEREGLAWLARHPEACPPRIWGKPFSPHLVSFEHFCQRRIDNTPGWRIDFVLLEVIIPNPWEGLD